MSADTLTKSDVELHTGTTPDDVAHIVHKTDWERGYLNGEQVEALCGHRFIPTKPAEKLPLCQGCKAIFDDDQARDLAAGRTSL